MFTCPHCGKPGITVLQKLMSAGAAWYGWSATCAVCGQRSRIAGAAINVQFGLFILGAATVPWLAGQAQLAAAYAVGAAILAVGLLAPLRKDLL